MEIEYLNNLSWTDRIEIEKIDDGEYNVYLYYNSDSHPDIDDVTGIFEQYCPEDYDMTINADVRNGQLCFVGYFKEALPGV